MSKSKTTKKADWIPATLSEYDGVRFLHLDSIWVQGAMRIRKPLHIGTSNIWRVDSQSAIRPTNSIRGGCVGCYW